jgi:hypothetical protein
MIFFCLPECEDFPRVFFVGFYRLASIVRFLSNHGDLPTVWKEYETPVWPMMDLAGVALLKFNQSTNIALKFPLPSFQVPCDSCRAF